MFSERDKAAARLIIRLFETGQKGGDYSAVAVLHDQAGISYGVNQATHKSGSLAAVVKAYTANPQAIVKELADYLPSLSHTDQSSIDSLARDAHCKKLLADAGADPLMHLVQVEVFDRLYLKPAIEACDGSGFVEALSLAVIYDSMNQGGYDDCRDHVVGVSEEHAWVQRYVEVREQWLLDAPKRIRNQAKAKVIADSVYRPRALKKLIAENNWKLTTPFVLRKTIINETDFR